MRLMEKREILTVSPEVFRIKEPDYYEKILFPMKTIFSLYICQIDKVLNEPCENCIFCTCVRGEHKKRLLVELMFCGMLVF